MDRAHVTGSWGRATLTTNEREIEILFTNRSVGDLEKHFGRNIVSVFQGLMDGSTGINEWVVVLRAGMELARQEAGQPGPPIALETAWRVMEEAKFGPVVNVLVSALTEALGLSTETESADEVADPNL